MATPAFGMQMRGGTRTDAAAVATSCRARTVALPPAPTQYTIELRAPAGVAGAGSGRVLLRWAPSPFGVSVSPDGHLVYDLSLVLRDLPAP
ncbi:MAG TPA: hypothetical protein VFN38_18165, partial [Gemmatimonadaceae bacterium]|nr:hypothetical protein [Gemmatimonadaceae bacterium]